MRRRTALSLALGLVTSTAVTLVSAPSAAAATVPAGFTDAAVLSVSRPTAVEWMPDDRIVVLDQSGVVRIGTPAGAFTAAITLTDLCTSGEKGLLGFTHDPGFFQNGYVYLYTTRTAPSFPGGCVNRVSRYTMVGNTILAGSELVLIDNISARNGNHNGGDLDFGSDGYLYVSIGDAGTNPRETAGTNTAAQDLSLLNGKILRITNLGLPAPGNPFTGPGTARCATRGNLPSTPTTTCQEIFAYGLRNPFRFAFDRNDGSSGFFINDVGQSTREEVDRGAVGANYGWPIREGQCPIAQNPPCAGPPAGFTDPITDYGRDLGHYITAGAFVPDGLWPLEYDGGYLFGDGYSGNVWLRRANGTVDYGTPFATGAVGIIDMTFGFDANGRMVLYYVVGGGGLRKITPTTAPAPSTRTNMRMIPITPERAYDTGDAGAAAVGVAGGNVVAGTTRLVDLDPPAAYEAALVNLTFAHATGPGYIRLWGTRASRPATSTLNSDAVGQVAANTAIVPLDANGTFVLESTFAGRVVVDVLAWLDETPGAVREGRYVSLDPKRLVDTREPAGVALTSGSSNPFSRSGADIVIDPAGEVGIPDDGTVGAVVLSVAAITAPGAGGGWVAALPTGGTWGGASNVNVGANDVRANLVIVPLGTAGRITLRTLGVNDVAVDVLGYVTGASAAMSTSGRYSSIEPVRVVDTRIGLGFGLLGTSPSTVVAPVTGAAVVQNVTNTQNSAAGWIATFPGGGSVPLVSSVNTSGPGQNRAVMAFTDLPADRRVAYVGSVPTHMVVDVVGVFSN